MWAYGCGVVSAGLPPGDRWLVSILGVCVAGPMVCATSQAVNDWFDRHVDAINEPDRPIPSGRMPGRWGLGLACAWTALSLVAAIPLGAWGFGATLLALALAWAYSAPPFRLKRNGWVGNAAVGLSYEGLAWITGAAVALAAWPGWPVVAVALLYSAGAHGIMTLNDFKSIEGDRRTGIGSLPARLGPDRAAAVACGVMLVAQLAVVGLLAGGGRPVHAAIVGGLVLAQLPLMRRFLRSPVERATWYSGFGVPLFVLGMLATAFGLRAGFPA